MDVAKAHDINVPSPRRRRRSYTSRQASQAALGVLALAADAGRSECHRGPALLTRARPRRPRGLVSSWSTKIAGPGFMNSQLKDDGQCAAPPACLQRRQRGRIVDVRAAELAAVLSDVRSAARPMRRVRVALRAWGGLRGRTTGGDRG